MLLSSDPKFDKSSEHQLPLDFKTVHPTRSRCTLFLPSPYPFTSSSFALFYFSLFHSLYLFSSFVHAFPFYQNSPTPFPGRRSQEATEPGFSLSCLFCVICIPQLRFFSGILLYLVQLVLWCSSCLPCCRRQHNNLNEPLDPFPFLGGC